MQYRFGIDPIVAVTFVHALRHGVLSEREARGLVAAAADQIRTSTEPKAAARRIDPVVRVARRLPLAADARAFLASYEAVRDQAVRARQTELGRSGGPGLKAKLAQRFTTDFGAPGAIFHIEETQAASDTTAARIRVMGVPFDVALRGEDAPVAVEMPEPIQLQDPGVESMLRQALQGDTKGEAGLRAYASAAGEEAGAVEWWLVWEAARGLEARVAVFDERGRATVSPYREDDDAGRALAAMLALDYGLAQARREEGPEAALEVLLRGSSRGSGDVARMEGREASPIGFDEAHEAQWEVGQVWSDASVYVTIDRRTGAVRVEHWS